MYRAFDLQVWWRLSKQWPRPGGRSGCLAVWLVSWFGFGAEPGLVYRVVIFKAFTRNSFLSSVPYSNRYRTPVGMDRQRVETLLAPVETLSGGAGSRRNRAAEFVL